MADIGQQFDHYRLVRCIGTGGTARVYLAERVEMPEMKVAIKVLKADINDDATKKAFMHEVKTLARLDHPHIIRIHDFGVKNMEPYIIMNFASGGNLGQIHSNHKPIAHITISAYVKQIAEALDYAYSKHQIVHCDLKPENIFVGSNQNILIADFGYARVIETTHQHSSTPEGTTWPYSAPEQFDAQRYGKPSSATDQYALGIMVYLWLSGHLPFTGDLRQLHHQHLYEQPPSLRKTLPDLAPEMEQVVYKALAKEPEKRYPNIQAFALALEKALMAPVVPPASLSEKSLNLPALATASTGLHPSAKTVDTGVKKTAEEASLPSTASLEKTLQPSPTVIPMSVSSSDILLTSIKPQKTEESLKDQKASSVSFWKVISAIGGGLLIISILVQAIIYSANASPTFSDKNKVIPAYCNALTHQNYAQIYKLFPIDSSFYGFLHTNRIVTIEKATITDETAYEQLARAVDNQKGKVTRCTITSIRQIATQSRTDPGGCAVVGDSVGCSDPTTYTTITLAFTLQITRAEKSPYNSRILVQADTKDSDPPSHTPTATAAQITTIESV